MTITPLIQMDPVWQPQNQQRIYRSLLTAMSFPGRPQQVAEPLGGARTELGVLAALADEQVCVADPSDRLPDAQRRLLATTFAAEGDADYVLVEGIDPPSPTFIPRLGTIYRPEEAALVIIACRRIGVGEITLILTGPGVESQNSVAVSGLHPAWIAARNRWCSNFPTGVDCILCDEISLIGIPRTSRVVIGKEP